MTEPITFASLNLAEPIQRALAAKNYLHPTPIQAGVIPHLLEGRDLIGCAQTGTGKTAAFALPILHRLAASPRRSGRARPRALILTPTRELASQISDNFAAYGRHLDLRHCVIFGGVGQNPQVRALQAGIDILVATPGRLLDLMQQGQLSLDSVEVFVLDEADRMLDMGFAPDVKRVIAKLPSPRQSLLFSATMPAPIREIAGRLLTNPVEINVAPVSSTADRIEQTVCHVAKADKGRLLLHVLTEHQGDRVLVFSRTKHGANKLAKGLVLKGIRAEAIHGNKSQGARERALDGFRRGSVRVLVATDIAARGIDVKGVSLVVNHDIPNEPESYVHRIGRTARAGADGHAVAFCEPDERGYLRDIEKLIRQQIPMDADHPFAIPFDPALPVTSGRGGGDRRPGGFRGRAQSPAAGVDGRGSSARGRSSSARRRGGNARRRGPSGASRGR